MSLKKTVSLSGNFQDSRASLKEETQTNNHTFNPKHGFKGQEHLHSKRRSGFRKYERQNCLITFQTQAKPLKDGLSVTCWM